MSAAAGVTEASAWIEGPNRVSFYTKRWNAATPKARVVFVHGIIEHVERYNYFFQQFAARGISVFAFDQRGWGQTGQKTKSYGITTAQKQLLDLEYFLAQEEQAYPGSKLFLYGHSMGGEIVMNYACRPDQHRPTLKKLAGIISSAPSTLQPPAVRVGKPTLLVGGIIGSLLPSLQMKIKISGQDLSHDQAVNEAYIKDPLCSPIATYKGLSDMFTDGAALLSKTYAHYPKTLPLLLYHGDEDKITWFDGSKELVEKINADDKTFLPLHGYYHEAHNEPGDMKEKVIQEVTEWILKH